MAARVDLNGIKDRIKATLDAANTATASPIFLSADLTKKVQRVLTVHPEMIAPQASFYPFVTCYIQDKEIVSDDIAKDQLSAKRQTNLKIDVVGAVFNQNMTSVDKDPADDEINYLMENVELVLRGSPNLGGLVQWQKPIGISYYTSRLNNQTHVRVGILTLQAKVWY